MKILLMLALTMVMTQGPLTLEERIQKMVPETQSADLSGQCPRYKISSKPPLMPRFKCRFT